MQVPVQKEIRIVNECGAIFEEEVLKKAILWASINFVAPCRKVYMHGNYPAVTINKSKVHVHRLIYSFYHKSRLNTKDYIHHMDRNVMNSKIENLEVMTASEHQSLTNKGKPIHKNTRIAIIESNKKRLGRKYPKRIIIEAVK